MFNAPLRPQLYQLHTALTQNAPLDQQDALIMALCDELAARRAELLPPPLYPPVIEVLNYYIQTILPALRLAPAARQALAQACDEQIQHLQTQTAVAHSLSREIAAFLQAVRADDFPSGAACWEALTPLLTGSPARDLSLPRTARPHVDGEYRVLRKRGWTTPAVTTFFRALCQPLLSVVVPSHRAYAALTERQACFWDGVQESLQLQAALVNTLTHTALLTRCAVDTIFTDNGCDALRFADNAVDERMLASCWAALRAARGFLTEHWPDLEAQRQAWQVVCRFPNPLTQYHDTSVSLLVALKIIGDVLELPLDPATVVTGAVTENGQILPVDHLPLKIAAAAADATTQRLFLPAHSLLPVGQRLALHPVNTLAEAVEQYYGAPYRSLRRQVSRRQLLHSAAALAVAPLAFGIFKHLRPSPVSEHDWRLLACARELYQQKSAYPNAVVILESLLHHLAQEYSAREAVRIKAEVLGYLGRILLQQHEFIKGVAAYQQALKLWQTLHETERQADILLYLGIAYADNATLANVAHDRETALWYYHQAERLASPAMQNFTRLRGNIALWRGVLYHAVNDQALAEAYVTTGARCFEDSGALWNYQLAQQHLGAILLRRGQYDQACDILQQTFSFPAFQNPFNHVKNLTGRCDLFLSTGQHEQGLAYAREIATLCRENHFTLQLLTLQHLLRRHHVSLSAVTV